MRRCNKPGSRAPTPPLSAWWARWPMPPAGAPPRRWPTKSWTEASKPAGARRIGNTSGNFLNRLSGLLVAHGKYRQGQRLWHASLAVRAPGGPARSLWEPLANVAQIADIVGSYPAARQFARTIAQAGTAEDGDELAAALFVRAFHARAADDLAQAEDDLHACLRLLARPAPARTPPAYRQFFSLVVQAELARVQGNYERSHTYRETAAQLAQVFGDVYTTADLLIDQAVFACNTQQFAETQAILHRLAEIAPLHANPHLAARCRRVEQRLARDLPPAAPSPDRAGPPRRAAILAEPLSDRETEVLQLVAAGWSTTRSPAGWWSRPLP